MTVRLALALSVALGCLGCGEEVQLTDGSTSHMDAAGIDAAGIDAAGSGSDGSVRDGSLPDAALPGDGSVGADGGPSGPIMCQGHLYACGNLMDDDDDGLIDAMDPDCLGPCDNNEEGYALNIPGGDSAPCRLDCYFDQDQGSGNDRCEWDHRCDPLEPDLNPACAYSDPPPPSAQCPDPQDPTCEVVCGPLVPNGCDCFGCCNLSAGGDRWVFIGSVDLAGTPTCSLEVATDDAACHPCTPVAACLNPCGECELCLGRTELPPECIPGTLPDGGMLDGGGVDAGPPMPTCDDGRQACGVPGLPPCPTGAFCLTGCCVVFG